MTFRRDSLLIYGAAFLRSTALGMAAVILGLYAAERNAGPGEIGLLIGAGLAGNALATFLASFRADLFGRKKSLLIFAFLSTAGALAFTLSEKFSFLLGAAFLGMLNGMGRDRGPCTSLEQAILPATAAPEKRTLAFAFYNGALDLGHASGGLLALFPAFLRRRGMEQLTSYQGGFFLYAALLAGSFLLYLGLSGAIELRVGPDLKPGRLSPESRKIITRLSGLFAIDSLGSGFLNSALLSYWFMMRFGAREEIIGPVFFAARAANMFSHFAAAWLSKKIGSINTMVFTHIPSSIFLMIVPLAPSLPVAILLYFLRECLVEMDVPVRQSYVMAVVKEEERTMASGITHLVRLAGWAVSPPLAGAIMKFLALSSPLYMGAGLKIAYDLALFRLFRHHKPPEEKYP